MTAYDWVITAVFGAAAVGSLATIVCTVAPRACLIADLLRFGPGAGR